MTNKEFTSITSLIHNDFNTRTKSARGNKVYDVRGEWIVFEGG